MSRRIIIVDCQKNFRRIICVVTYCLVFILLFTVCDAYSGLIPPDPANSGKCVYRGDTLEVGEINGISPCQRLNCYQNGSILIEGCGRLRIENCNRGERINLGKPFPECCKLKYKCKMPDGTPYYIERDAADADGNKMENSA